MKHALAIYITVSGEFLFTKNKICSIRRTICSTICKAHKDTQEITTNLYTNLIAGRKVNQGYDHPCDVFLQKV